MLREGSEDLIIMPLLKIKLIARIYVLDVKLDLVRLSLTRDMSYLSQMFQYQREF